MNAVFVLLANESMKFKKRRLQYQKLEERLKCL